MLCGRVPETRKQKYLVRLSLDRRCLIFLLAEDLVGLEQNSIKSLMLKEFEYIIIEFIEFKLHH